MFMGVEMERQDDPLYWLREHGPRLIAFARQFVACRADAEDVFQEAFVHFWQNRETAREPLLYLYRCVRNAAMDWGRRRERRQRHERAARAVPTQTPPGARLDRAETDREVHEAMSRLPERQRQVVALRVWSDMTFDQIGQVLSIPLSTAHALYGAAMRTLQNELKKTVQP
jgi:RNA polymerase sigma-70 factor (ECF subfamily)